MEFTTREIASAIVFVSVISLAVFLSRDRAGIRSSSVGVVRAIFGRQILISIGAYFLYAAMVLVAAHRLKIWSFDTLKDALITVIFVGFPLVMNASSSRSGKELLRKVIVEVIGLTALATLYLDLAPFHLVWEIILQFAVLFLTLIAAMASINVEHAVVARVAKFLLGAIGIVVIVNATAQLLSGWSTIDWSEEIEAGALTVWLPIVLIPFLYVFGFLMELEMALVRIKLNNRGVSPSFAVRIGFIMGTHGSLHYIKRFKYHWISDIATKKTYRGTLQTMRSFRQSVRSNAEAETDRLRRVDEMAGVQGTDDRGLVRDRREFYETKEFLTNLFFHQMGWFRNRGGTYQQDPLRVVPKPKGLPDDHGLVLKVRKDGRAWYGWRVTPSGYVFAVGGSPDVESRWQYDGATPPTSFPQDRAQGWANSAAGPGSPEWEESDAPIREA